MARALGRRAAQLALDERAAPVGAGVANGVQLAVGSREEYGHSGSVNPPAHVGGASPKSWVSNLITVGSLARIFSTKLQRVDATEYLDRPGQIPSLLAGNLDDLRRINRWLGGYSLTLRGLEYLLEGSPSDVDLKVVDVGTGGADVPDAIVAWSYRHERRVRVLAGDVSPEIIQVARRKVGPRVDLAVLDGLCLPLADGSVDVAVCSLILHHLPSDDAVALLREMRRVSRRGIVVNDLVRSRPGYLGALAIGWLATRNPLTRHDGPLSVRRAYTKTEMADLASRAGLGRLRFCGYLGYRIAMAAEALP